MVNTNNTTTRINYFVKFVLFFKTFMFLMLIVLGISTNFAQNPLLLAVFAVLLLILSLTQVFGMLSISNGYIDKRNRI